MVTESAVVTTATSHGTPAPSRPIRAVTFDIALITGALDVEPLTLLQSPRLDSPYPLTSARGASAVGGARAGAFDRRTDSSGGTAARLKRGLKRGQVQTLRKLLRLRFGELDEATLKRLESADEATLDRYAERILTASSLDELFAN